MDSEIDEVKGNYTTKPGRKLAEEIARLVVTRHHVGYLQKRRVTLGIKF